MFNTAKKWAFSLFVLGMCTAGTVSAKELAVCYADGGNAPALFTDIKCQDSIVHSKNDWYYTTLYKMIKQGWEIVAIQEDKNGTQVERVKLFLQK